VLAVLAILAAVVVVAVSISVSMPVPRIETPAERKVRGECDCEFRGDRHAFSPPRKNGREGYALRDRTLDMSIVTALEMLPCRRRARR
jgi:hypothetical protein